MHVLSQVWSLPKAGNREEEYEDASWPENRLERDVPFCQFAVADGATETSFSGVWARILVKAYCQGKFNHKRMWQNMDTQRREWERKVHSKQLPWYAEEKLQMGAYSSLIGLTVYAPNENDAAARWEALAIGDSCLFQTRDENLILKWPLQSSDQFGYHPILLSTKFGHDESSVYRSDGKWLAGDSFFLMTDAIAQWYLSQIEKGRSPAEIIPNFPTDDSCAAFADWVTRLRQSAGMRNDDVTLMRVVVT